MYAVLLVNDCNSMVSILLKIETSNSASKETTAIAVVQAKFSLCGLNVFPVYCFPSLQNFDLCCARGIGNRTREVDVLAR